MINPSHHVHSEHCHHDHDEQEVSVTIHSDADFDGMRKAGKLAAQTLDYITPFVKEGITTEELDKLCHEYIIKNTNC